MYDDYGPAPRCTGCEIEKKKWELGDKFLMLKDSRWVNVYELDAPPVQGQGEPTEHDGRPIAFRGGYGSTGHSDECYHWAPPQEPPKPDPVWDKLMGDIQKETPSRSVSRRLAVQLEKAPLEVLQDVLRRLRAKLAE